MIPDSHIDLLTKGHVAHLATINPDNTPQISPIWIDYHQGLIHFNTAVGRKKYRNITKNKAVALSITDKNDPYRYITIQGRVIDENQEQDEAREHIKNLGVLYTGEPFIPPESQIRVILKIKPLYVSVS